MSASLTLFLIGAVHAAAPVISAGEDPRVVLTRAAAASGRAPDDLLAVTFADLAVVHPAVVEGGGAVGECRGQPVGMGSIRDTVERAERALAYLELDKARAHLGLGETLLRCLSEPADAAVSAQLYFLAGFTAASEGDETRARESFRRTLAFEPTFAWDNTYPPDGQELLESLRSTASASPLTSLTVVPATSDSEVWVDGRSATPAPDGTYRVAVGPHLVQVVGALSASFDVTLRAPDAPPPPPPDVVAAPTPPLAHRLVVPSLMPLNAAAWATDTTRQPELAAVLAAMFEPDSTVYVSTAGRVLAHTVGRSGWEDLKVPTNLARVSVANTRLVAGRTLFYAGAAGVAGGLIVAGSAWTSGASAVRSAEAAADWSVYADAQSRYESAASRMTIAQYTLLGGTLLTGGGVLLQLDDIGAIFGKERARTGRSASVAPLLAPGAVGVTVAVTP